MATDESRLARKRAYYRVNQGSERRKARERAKRRNAQAPQDIARNQEKHRQAQARYRERNRELLAVRAVAYRLTQKRKAAIEKDEDEFQRLWNSVD